MVRLLPYIPPLWGKYYHYYYCRICGKRKVFFGQAGVKDITRFKYSKLTFHNRLKIIAYLTVAVEWQGQEIDLQDILKRETVDFILHMSNAPM